MADTVSPIYRLLVIFAACTIIVGGMKLADELIVPFILSIFIAMVVSPLVTVLRMRGIPHGVSILLVVGLMLSAGFLFGAVIGSAMVNFQSDLPEYSAKLAVISSDIQARLAEYGIVISSEQWQSSFDPGALMLLVANMLTSFGNVMTNGLMILLTVVFILV